MKSSLSVLLDEIKEREYTQAEMTKARRAQGGCHPLGLSKIGYPCAQGRARTLLDETTTQPLQNQESPALPGPGLSRKGVGNDY